MSTSPSYWKDRVVVVTGGSSGLGLAIAEEFIARDATVVLVARNKKKLEQAAEKMVALGGKVAIFVADVTQALEVHALALMVRDTYGRIDVLCHAAGRSMRGTLEETTVEDFQELWELNFLSAVRCVRAFQTPLLSGSGHVVLIGSLASRVAPKYLAAYPTSKFPLTAYAQQLRLELGPKGLHTLFVCPGPLARSDSGTRYASQAGQLPDSANKPGGGAKIKALSVQNLAAQIVTGCEQRRPEIVLPKKARILFILAAISSRLGDWLLLKKSAK